MTKLGGVPVFFSSSSYLVSSIGGELIESEMFSSCTCSILKHFNLNVFVFVQVQFFHRGILQAFAQRNHLQVGWGEQHKHINDSQRFSC